MDYFSKANSLSNVSVVDIFLIDEVAECIDSGEITPRAIIDLARLIEAFVLNNEVVIKDHAAIYNEYNTDFDYQFTEQWLKIFYDCYTIRSDEGSAARLLCDSFPDFNSLISRKIEKIYSDCEDDFDFRQIEELEFDTRTWANMAKFYGIPFLSPDWLCASMEPRRVTNISMDLYHKMEKYYNTYFEKISKYLGPTYVRIPTLLSLVLQESRSIEEIPLITAQVKDRFSDFVLNTTTLEIQLRTANTIAEQIEIVDEIENSYANATKKCDTSKKRIQSRVFDIVQSLDIKEMVSKGIAEFRKWNVEENGLLLIPGYYNMWEASKEVEQSLPLLKRLFGKQIDNDFLLELHRLNL